MPLLSSGPSRFLGGGGIATPVPTLGAELLADGGFENWASATDLTSWIETKAGSSTINQESSVVHGGTYAVRLTIDSSNNNADVSQNGVTTANVWHLLLFWAKSSVAGKTITSDYVPFGPLSLTTDWTQYIFALRPTFSAVNFRRAVATSSDIYLDDFSYKRHTLSTMFAGRTMADGNQDVSAPVTIVSRTRAGVVARLDSLTSPANFLIASHDGVNARLTQCKAGAYTELIATAATYVAGAAVRIWCSGSTAKLYYNGSQVGTDQSVDAALTGTIFGKFNTYASNVIGACTIVPAV